MKTETNKLPSNDVESSALVLWKRLKLSQVIHCNLDVNDELRRQRKKQKRYEDQLCERIPWIGRLRYFPQNDQVQPEKTRK